MSTPAPESVSSMESFRVNGLHDGRWETFTVNRSDHARLAVRREGFNGIAYDLDRERPYAFYRITAAGPFHIESITERRIYSRIAARPGRLKSWWRVFCGLPAIEPQTKMVICSSSGDLFEVDGRAGFQKFSRGPEWQFVSRKAMETL